MPSLTEPSTDARLGKAGELAAYLRDNPKEARRDPEELAGMFGVDARLVAQIQAQTRYKTPKAGPNALIANIKQATAKIAEAMDRLLANPYFFQLGAGAGCLLIAAFVPKVGGTVGTVSWAIAEAACILLRPKFRNVVFGSAALWVGSAVLLAFEFRKEDLPAPFGGSAGPILLGGLLGLVFALLSLVAGGVLVVVGGVLQISAQRRKDSSKSRQDLLSRMFALQEQLEIIPPKQEKLPHPFVAFARTRLFLVAFLLMIALRLPGMAATLLMHIDPYAIQTGSRVVATKANPDVRVSTLHVPAFYMLIQVGLQIVRIVSVVFLGRLATSWRKVWQLAAGFVIAEAVAAALEERLGASGSTPASLVVASAASGAFTWVLILLLVRFSAWFNRLLTRYRLGTEVDEASIVSELLEIRYRLFANPVQVSVLVVDAAGSTAMKRNAESVLVEYSFGNYQRWIAETVSRHRGKVEIMTGDGAICAFGASSDALEAAQDLQNGVADLNATANRLAHPFRLRIALHTGAVVADLDKVQFTEVIDVAAHVEKYSPVGGIALTAPFLKSLPTLPDLPGVATVDGVDIFTMPATGPGPR